MNQGFFGDGEFTSQTDLPRQTQAVPSPALLPSETERLDGLTPIELDAVKTMARNQTSPSNNG